MGRKKREKRKKKRRAGENTKTLPKNTAAAPIQPDQAGEAGAADLSHLSGDWREFYRLVIDRLTVLGP